MQGEAEEFVAGVFGKPFPTGLRIELWNLHTHDVTSLPSSVAIPAALPRQLRDTYISVGYSTKKPAKGRTKAAAVAGIPALWLDIDVNGGPDEKRGAMATLDEAVDLAHRFVSPTFLVNSGYGVHAWWVFDTPWVFTDDLDRTRAQRASRLWQEAHRAAAKPAKLDSTHDLARLMRLPGTLNGKGGIEVPVMIMRHDGIGELHPLADLLDCVGSSVSDSPGSEGSGGSVAFPGGSLSLLDAPVAPDADAMVVDTTAQPPQAKFQALLEASPEFEQTWTRKRPERKTKDWSHSEWDFSLASQAGYAGWSKQETCDLLMAYRAMHDPTGDKAKRADYIPRTVQKAFDTLRISEARQRITEMDAKQDAQDAENQLAAIELAELGERAASGEDVSIETLEAFNRVIRSGVDGAPRVVSIVQTSEDPTTARYTLTFHDGRSLVCSPRTLAVSKDFGVALMAVTGHVLPTIKASYWVAAIRALLLAREIHHAPEVGMHAVVSGAIDAYTANAIGVRDDEVIEAGQPWLDQGEPRFTLDGLVLWLGRRPGSNVSRGDVAASLRTLGWRAQPVTYRSARGTKTSKSYYVPMQETEAAQAAVDDAG